MEDIKVPSFSDDEIKAMEDKAADLSNKRGNKVHPIAFIDPDTGEKIIGYIDEPNRVTKMRVLDKGMVSPMQASAELYEVILIKEESNPRLYSQNSADDSIYIGAVNEAYNTVKISINQFKKK